MDTASSLVVRGSVCRDQRWFARHWTVIAGLAMFGLAAIADATAIVDPSRDWFGLFAWGAIAGCLVLLWLSDKIHPRPAEA